MCPVRYYKKGLDMWLRGKRLMLLRMATVPVVFLSLFGGSRWADDSLPVLILEAFGYLLIVGGLLFRVWAWLYMGERKARPLVTEGPYSICRNPLYVGTVMIALGLGLCLSNVLVIALTVLVIIPLHAWVALAEEQHLHEAYGAEYEAYKRRVPRFIVSPSLYRSPEQIAVSAAMLRKAGRDAFLVILTPGMVELLEMLHQSHALPIFWTFP